MQGHFRITSFMRWTFDHGCCKVGAETCYPSDYIYGLTLIHFVTTDATLHVIRD